MVWLFKGTIKWLVLALIWLASVVFVTTSALLMDAISDGLSNVFGVSTPYAQQKNNNLKQKTAIKKQDAAIKKQQAAIRRTRGKSQKLAAKMVSRNVLDISSSLLPLGGAVIGIGLAAADVYGACELIDLQNELSETLEIPTDKSVGDELCLDAVATVERLPDLPDINAPEWEVPDLFSTSKETLTEWMCSVSGDC
jgi:hypothetical protein